MQTSAIGLSDFSRSVYVLKQFELTSKINIKNVIPEDVTFMTKMGYKQTESTDTRPTKVALGYNIFLKFAIARYR